MEPFYQELEHTADWAIRVWGQTVAILFERAAAAMFELQGADLAAQPVLQEVASCEAGDLEALLIVWLSELLYLSEMNDALYTRFQVAITTGEEGFHLQGRAQGLPGRGHLAHVKAVTYYDLSITQTKRGWEAVVTFDT